MESVVNHFIHVQGLTDADIIVLLEPPATFRRSRDLNAAIDHLLAHPEASGVRTVTRVIEPPYFLNTIEKGFMNPIFPLAYRGHHPTLWRDNGVANVIRVKDFNVDGQLMTAGVLGLEIKEPKRGLDIDEPHELLLAQEWAKDLDRIH